MGNYPEVFSACFDFWEKNSMQGGISGEIEKTIKINIFFK